LLLLGLALMLQLLRLWQLLQHQLLCSNHYLWLLQLLHSQGLQQAWLLLLLLLLVNFQRLVPFDWPALHNGQSSLHNGIIV
jgi:hypothetical protein